VVDLAIVLAFVAYSVAAGFRARREASRSLVDLELSESHCASFGES
jgi:hypothetical protein